MLDWWAANWQAVVGVMGTLLGVPGIYLALKGWKRKMPTYVLRSNNIFSGLEHTVPDVEVKFPGYGQPITALTVTKIGFWNAGNETIKKQDVVKDGPIAIQGNQGIIFLSASVLESVCPHNKIDCKLSQDRSHVTITFEYLDHNQGANIQVFHTGTSIGEITVPGTIMGASPIRRKRRENSPEPPGIWIPLIMFCASLLLLGLGALGLGLPKPDPAQPGAPEYVPAEGIGVVLLVITVGMGILLYFAHIPKPFSKVLRQ